MHKDAKNMDYVSIDLKGDKRVGRPSRSDADKMKSIAWYHALANGRRPVEMINWLPFSDVDPRTIYRYRKGEIPPRRDFLNSRSEEFVYAKSVYEVGPLQVPLWDALWGSISSKDISLANQLMPGAQWPSDMLSELFFDDGDLAKISDFRAMYRLGKERSSASDFECFVGAIRVTRAWGEVASKNKSIFHLLLNGTMAFPGAVAAMEQFGLREPIRKWISDYLGVGCSAERGSESYCYSFGNERELAYQCEKAEAQRMKVGNGLRRALFTL